MVEKETFDVPVTVGNDSTEVDVNHVQETGMSDIVGSPAGIASASKPQRVAERWYAKWGYTRGLKGFDVAGRPYTGKPPMGEDKASGGPQIPRRPLH